jgi:hypothetical protein
MDPLSPFHTSQGFTEHWSNAFLLPVAASRQLGSLPEAQPPTELAAVSKTFEPVQTPTLAFTTPSLQPSPVEARGGGSGSVPTQADAPPCSPTRGQLPCALTEWAFEDLVHATAISKGQGKLTKPPSSSRTRGQLPRALTDWAFEDLVHATAISKSQGKLNKPCSFVRKR